MEFDVQGEMDVEVDGEAIHFFARDNRFEFILPRLSTFATVARAFPHLPMVSRRSVSGRSASGRLASIRWAMSFCDHVIIKVEDVTVMTIKRREGRRFFSLTHHQVAFENKKLWIKNSYKLLWHYFRRPGLPTVE